MRKLRNRESGFTLVELLIVIALISVLAVALVATLNPVEQINKARDARYKNDAAELLAAIERNYASTLSYPWIVTGGGYCGGSDCTIENAYGDTGDVQGPGVCAADCDTDGTLITGGELKSSFKNKEQFDSDVELVDQLHVYKEEGASGSVYTCFIPKAGTNRDTDLNPNLRLWDIYTGDAYLAPSTCVLPADAAAWGVLNTTCFICIPE